VERWGCAPFGGQENEGQSGDLTQASTPITIVLNDFPPHSWVPESADVTLDAPSGYAWFWVGRKKRGDVVDHGHKTLSSHQILGF
jgi:hypothetical protein